MSEFKRVLSPLLHVASFVGKARDGKPVPNSQDGKPWLWAAEHGFSFCVAEIDESFKPLPFGQCVRIEVGVKPFDNSIEFRVNDACGVSELADLMLLATFGATDYEHLEKIIADEFFDGFENDDPPDFEDEYPEEVIIHYRVVLV